MSDAYKFNAQEISSGRLSPAMITQLVRYWQTGHRLKVDGRAGPVTQASIHPVPPTTVPPMVVTVEDETKVRVHVWAQEINE